MIKCDKCNRPSVTFIRYNGAHLCKDHFIQYFERRVKREVRKQCRFEKAAVICAAVSGGKDSLSTLFILNKIFEKRKAVSIYAITVDEGIEDYRPKAIDCVIKLCKELDVEHHIASLKEYIGYTMDEIAPLCKEYTPCAYCGVFRRKSLNMMARELNATQIATGLNLDDTAQSLLMNFTRGDVEKLARLGPHKKVQPSLIPRIQPLRTIPEKESYLYAMLNEIDFYEGRCPYAGRALRNTYRSITYSLENEFPGTRHAILKSYDSIHDLLLQKYPAAKLLKCESCGEPTPNPKCKACIFKEKIDAVMH